MPTIKGIVEKAHRKDSGYCSILVDGTWYSTYKTLHSELEGKVVEFEAVQKGDFWNAKGTPTVLAQPAATTVAPAAAPAAPGARQTSITLQSSYKTATELVVGMLANDILTVPSKKADRYDAILNYVDEVALRIYGNVNEASAPGFVAGEEVEEEANPAPEGWNAAEA